MAQKGKIDHRKWPDILARHRAGESFANLARRYGCSAPAIRYIVQREADATQNRPRRLSQQVHGIGRTAHGTLRHELTRLCATALNLSGNKRSAKQPLGGVVQQRIEDRFRDKVMSDIAIFLVAFDIALHRDAPMELEDLLKATDRLLRAAALTRIMIEDIKKEARFAPVGVAS